MVAVVDYGVGNVFSLKSSLDMVGAASCVTGCADGLRRASHIILPGVGAFRDARQKLAATGLDQVILEEAARGKPLFGICLGMQMLFDRSFEYGEYPGLGLIPGNVKPIRPVIGESLKVPHIGWNALKFYGESPLFRYIQEGDWVYFVHSFAAMDCRDSVIATAEYSAELTAAVQRGNVFGTQFHPEKSGSVGLNILKAFCEVA